MCLLVDKSSLFSSQFESMKKLKKFYVVPESQNGDSLNCNETECHPLTFYMNHSREHPSPYFNSHEMYIFLNGKHSPLANTTVVIKQKTRLTFIGLSVEGKSTSAIIDCNGQSVGFVFRESSNITIESLTFSLCIRTSIGNHHSLATLAFEKGFNLFLTSVTLQGSVDEAIFVKDIQGIVHFREVSIRNARSQVSRNMNTIFNSECNNDSLQLIIEDSTFVGNFMPASVDSNNVSQGSIDNYPFAAGLSITLKCLSVSVEIDNVTMVNNEGGNGGGLALVFFNTSSTIDNTVIIQNSVFKSGKAYVGAGLFVEFIERSESKETLCFHSSRNEHQLLFVRNTTFKNNSAVYAGGAVYLKQKQSWASCSVGKISFVNCTFQHNSVTRKGFGGTALHSINYPITGYRHHGVPQFKILLKMCIFSENHAEPYNVSQSGNGVIFTKSDSFIKLFDVKITNNTSSGILAIGSNIILSGNITIKYNQGSSGGGLLLCENAVIYFDVNSTVVVTHNQVRHTGGGISVETQCLQSRPMCFFQLTENILNDLESIHTVEVSIHDNTAGFAGHNLFGGSVDHCFMLDRPHHHHQPNKSIDIYKSIFHFPNVPSSVTSEPRQLCLCKKSGRYECSPDNDLASFERYPGQPFTLKAVLVGQLQGIVPGTVQAFINVSDPFASLREKDKVQKLSSNSSCGTLTYAVYSNGSAVELHLGAQHSGDESGYEQLNNFKKLKLNVVVKRCPPGFELFTESDKISCKCVGLLRFYGIECDITTQLIHRRPSFWIGYHNSSETTLLHIYCPFDYCIDTMTLLNSSDIVLTSDTSRHSQQCAHYRTGMLCGTCIRGHSVVLGSGQCQVCSNYWLLMIIVIALSGILLVFALTSIDMTITEGTISGLLFYCNIINSNVTTFFAEQSYTFISPLLKFFVSSLSLTMGGLPMCLYNGLNAYSVTWLSFAYPFYIWLIAGLLVCLGYRFNWLVRHNSVKVLATLIILSYSSLLHSVIEALQPTHLHHDHGKGSYLWLKDGSIRYFVGKHIPLVFFASLLGLILLPFTVCLLFIQCLFKVSHYWLFSWVNRLKPFFDAYTGPFTAKARFWTGLLLLARIIIYTASAVNLSSNRVTNIAIISVISFILLFISSILKDGLYKRRSLTILEQAMMLNLGLLSTVTIGCHDKPTTKIVTHLCVGVAFITFVWIVLHHVKFVRRSIRQIWSRITAIITTSRSIRVHYDHLSDEDNNDLGMDPDMFPPFAQFDQSREPLLD